MKNCRKSILFVLLFSLMSILIADTYRVLKSGLPKHRIDQIEPVIKIQSSIRETCPMAYPENPNAVVTVVDSSANGYGMVSCVTRPIDVNANNKWVLSFRQFVSNNNTHGQIGGAVSVNGLDWTIYSNINDCTG